MFSTWTIARKISGVVAVGLVSLLGIGVLAYSTTAELLRNAGMVTHTHQVLEANDSILSLLKDAETGQRGYLITGEPRYLEPYNDSKNSIQTTIQRLKQLTSANPAQQTRLGEMEGLIEGKFKELQETIDLRKNSGFDAARAVVLTDQGKRVMDDIRKKLSEVDQHERVLLQQRSEETRSSADTTQAVILWGTLACLGLSGTLAFVVIRGVSRILLVSVSELASGADQLAGAAAQVAAASQALAQGSSEQAASIEETSASSEEVNSMARRNSESSRSAADLVQESQQKFTETSHSLEQMVAAMDEIKASSGRISTIIKTIDEIAFQTNILL